jgi:hypothetical protein
MKTRNGFVSNSSSSSFIIRNGDIGSVATSMLNTVIDDFGDWDRDEGETSENPTYDKWRDNLKEALDNPKVENGKIGITMPSCNYETYIFKKGKDIYVSTANNHAWEWEELGATERGYGADDGDQDLVHRYVDDQEYFNIKNKLIHSKRKWEDDEDTNFSDKTKRKCCSCKNYHGEYVMAGKKKVCAECFEGIIGENRTLESYRKEAEKEAEKWQKILDNLPKYPSAISQIEL